MSKSGKSSMLGKFGAALLALTASAWSAAATQPVSVDEAPQAWVDYAQRVSARFQAALESDNEAAQRFYAYVDAQVAAQIAAPVGDVGAGTSPADVPAPRVKAWIDRSGQVTRIEIDGVDSPQARDDLRRLLLAQAIGAAPPRKMTQPVVVRLSVGAEL